jgi:hypothetical protein
VCHLNALKVSISAGCFSKIHVGSIDKNFAIADYQSRDKGFPIPEELRWGPVRGIGWSVRLPQTARTHLAFDALAIGRRSHARVIRLSYVAYGISGITEMACGGRATRETR